MQQYLRYFDFSMERLLLAARFLVINVRKGSIGREILPMLYYLLFG